MKRDIHKFSEWLEKTVTVRLSDERALRELKLNEKRGAGAPEVSVRKSTKAE